MAPAASTFAGWLQDRAVPQDRLTAPPRAVREAAGHFLPQRGPDYFSRRLLSHFLRHAPTGLKVAQLARRLGFSRSAASAQQGLSSTEVVQAAHHRLAGRAHGKLLPRFAGPIAQFLHDHPEATRYDLLDFIRRTWGVAVSRMALHRFLTKYGLDQASRLVPLSATAAAAAPLNPVCPGPEPTTALGLAATPRAEGAPLPQPPPEFFGPHPLRRRLRALAPSSRLAGHRPGLLRRCLRLAPARAAEQRVRPGHRPEAAVPPGPAGGPGLRRAPRRPHLPDAARRGRLAAAPALVRGRGLLPPDAPLGVGPRRRRPGQLRRAHPAPLDADVRHRQGLRDHPQPVPALREALRRLPREGERYRCVQAAPGPVGLRDGAVPLTRRVLQAGRPRHLHAPFDAGAGKADADARALLQLAAAEPNLTVPLRACRYPHRVRAWKPLPSGVCVAYEEPGPWVGAPPREIRLAETATVLKGEGPAEAVRTVVCREVVAGPKQDRWHPRYPSGQAEPVERLGQFRQRPPHEQAYRVGVPGAFPDAAPCGSATDSPDPRRPRFPRGPLPMMGWLLALVSNAVGDLGAQLAGRYHRAPGETLRRTFFQRPGKRYLTPEALIVYRDPFRGQEELVPVIEDSTGQQGRIPWLENRRPVLSLTPDPQRQRGGP